MQAILTAIPDVEVLIGLEPEELGAKLLFIIRSNPAQIQNNMFTLDHLMADLFESNP
jgi:hypothetical protein